ncbi:hypothetical protein TorRG33x02_189770 [Trema orientale]|uniref:Uncharacterized protein n=1 Tax=Trema orientale TaxID=63057 RepID=A0A2P5EIF1_TREOI|nr:hypothetical protein TorRG33x02_189770 [Trema orientale]
MASVYAADSSAYHQAAAFADDDQSEGIKDTLVDDLLTATLKVKRNSILFNANITHQLLFDG